MKLTAILLACSVSLPAGAATLKPFNTIPGPVVRLSDLWDGVLADKPLGPAPAPGGRITVPAPQLAAIAKQFGVDWRPGSSSEHAVLERAGRPLTMDDIRPPLWEALTGAGARPDAELELGAFTAAPLPTEGDVQLTIEQLEYDPTSGRFSANLDIAAEGVPNAQVRLTGRVQEMVDLPVVRSRMMPGDVIRPEDLQWLRLRAALARGEFVTLPAQAIGQALKHAVAPNQPILLADLGRPVVVTKGMNMTLSLESPGLSLTAQGV
ncbi:MAG: flagellar basal body P-ring formation protein FlgA, partial [Acetobacteraceae bacterium]|nr:flagellar basal body P-ring formation protein FlgA [Acetobacteraceae bacterium]